MVYFRSYPRLCIVYVPNRRNCNWWVISLGWLKYWAECRAITTSSHLGKFCPWCPRALALKTSYSEGQRGCPETAWCWLRPSALLSLHKWCREFCVCLIELKASEKPYHVVFGLSKWQAAVGKSNRRVFLQDVCIYIKLLQNKPSLGKTATCTWLWRAAGGRDSWGWCRSGVSCMGNVLILAHLLTLPVLFCLCSYLAQIKQVKKQSLCFSDFFLLLPKLKF